MATYKIVDAERLDGALTASADAIRAKTGSVDQIPFDMENATGFAAAIAAVSTGGGASQEEVQEKDVNFYDYDGTLLHSYTLAEAQVLDALPDGAEHDGLVFQGWNWTLSSVNALARPMDIGAMYITDDGATRVYITLVEGRTSPMLGVGVNGTVTVDWGDGSEADTLTGANASAVQWTPTHEYAAPGDYVIRLTVDGEMSICGIALNQGKTYLFRHSTGADARNIIYQQAIRRVEIGANVYKIDNSGLSYLRNAESVSLPEHLTYIGTQAFQDCDQLTFVTIPSNVTSFATQPFGSCDKLKAISFPPNCPNLPTAVLMNCSNLRKLTLPDSISAIPGQAFRNLYNLTRVCFPPWLTTILGLSFDNCPAMRVYDFTACTAVPVLSEVSAFGGIPDDCEIHVPTALYDEWIAATNWATYADYIVAV